MFFKKRPDSRIRQCAITIVSAAIDSRHGAIIEILSALNDKTKQYTDKYAINEHNLSCVIMSIYFSMIIYVQEEFPSGAEKSEIQDETTKIFSHLRDWDPKKVMEEAVKVYAMNSGAKIANRPDGYITFNHLLGSMKAEGVKDSNRLKDTEMIAKVIGVIRRHSSGWEAYRHGVI